MAIEEEISKPSSLPSYPELIMEAIDALKQTDDADSSSISEFIESKYSENLPAEHEDLLSSNLATMAYNGELLLTNNKYLKPGPDAPAKRGRGRPPKAKEPSAAGTIASPAVPVVARGRGRPKKDPNAPSAAKKAKPSAASPSVSQTGRPRGRPRKMKPEAVQNGVEA